MSTSAKSEGSMPPAERERPLYELLSRDMVDLYVGSENTHWIIHEKLLCHRSRFFRNIFYNKKGKKNSMYGLPDEDDEPFRLFIGWLYSAHVPPVKEEKDLTHLLDLYLMSEKWDIKQLRQDVLEEVRKWYHDTDTWPGLRRVQYIYSNTEPDSPMRQLLVGSVSRMLVLGEGMPAHWENALKKNGALAVDIIRNVQQWHIQADDVPDSRSQSLAPTTEETQEIMKAVDVKKEAGENGQDGDERELSNGMDHVKVEDAEDEDSTAGAT